MPSRLPRDFEELQGYYNASDWLMFDTVFEAVEVIVKAYYLAGIISIDDLKSIFEKYGIA